ncbi:MAG: hypothetical protein M3Y87_27700 [Myxococcota bacterium]|nr:hypothetical protein [Myxococcota bacterium]
MRTNAIMAIGTLALGLAATAPAAAQDRAYEYETGYEQGYEQAQAQAQDYDFVRFRFGASGVGGGHWAGGPDIGMGGAQLRLGVQIGQMFAVYYQPTGLVGSIVDRPGSAGSAAGLLWNTAMAEVTLADFIQIGGGPSMDFVWGCDRNFQAEVDCDSTDPFIGAHGRVALALGGHGPGRRGGVTISADVHPTWYRSDDPSIAVLGGIGFELY